MLNKKRNGLSGITLAALVFIGSFNGSYRYSEVYAEEDYHSWSQMDERWADIPMGYSNMAVSGCFVTSIAILAAHSGSVNPESFNPGVFAQAINGINGFTYGGALASWSTVSAIIPDVKIQGVNYFKSSDKSGKADEIRSVMENGYYVICNVGNHWVFVENVTDDDVYMIDPAKDEILMFDTYSNYDITEYEVITGKNPPSLFTDISNDNVVTTDCATEITTETTTETTTTKSITETTTTETSTTETTTKTTTTESTTETTTTETTTTESTTETTTTETSTTETTTTETTTAATTGVSTEFYYSGEETACIYTSSGEVIAEITSGQIVEVRKVENGYGLVTINGEDGWIDMSSMNLAENFVKSVRGDINKDGEINLYDIS
ncbi:MAG: hypothetical protein K2I06_06200, partial [Ruminococcus sp.]|nr:hypothetical protein [Ruminococcus sp.]